MNVFAALISIMVYIYVYFMASTYFTHRKFNYLQETSLAIVVGLVVGMVLFLTSDFYRVEEGNQGAIRNIIFLILLPPIMFEDGYNFPKRKFVQNILYVNLYGLLGTVLNFLCVWGLLTLFNSQGLFVSVSSISEVITLTNWQILLMAAAFCSIQPIVTQKVVDKARYPKLFSIMLGESLFKDTIAITLFQAVREMVIDSNNPTFDIAGSDIGYLILRFMEVVIGSIVIGFVGGILTTLVFKNLRFLVKEEGVAEMALTILSGYIVYLGSEWLELSGVISMLFCGTLLSHYNVYNLTDTGNQTTKVTVDVLKMAASGLIFFFIGFQVYDVQSFDSQIDQSQLSYLSVSLLGLTFVALLVGRAVNVYVVSLLGWLVVGREKWKLNLYEYFIIFLTGLIHGAVPFALSVTIPFLTGQPTVPSTNCVQLNIIFVVVISCLLFNTLVPKLIRLMLSRIRELQLYDRSHPSVKDSFLQGHDYLRLESKATVLDDPTAPLLKRLKTTTEKYWKKLENGFLKPHLIFNYHERKNQIKLDKLNKRKEEHERYLQKFNRQNVLNPDDDNVFYEVVYSNHGDDSDDEEEEHRIVIRQDPKVEVERKNKDNEEKKNKSKSKSKDKKSPPKQKETEISQLPKEKRSNTNTEQKNGKDSSSEPKSPRQAKSAILQSQDPKKHESKGQIVLTIEEKHQ